MAGLKCLILLLVAVSTIQGSNTVWKIAVTTATCDDCGMSNTFGALRMQVGNKYFISGELCITEAKCTRMSD